MAENPTLASHFLQVALLEEACPLALIYRGENFLSFWRRYEPQIGWVGYITSPESAIPALKSYAEAPEGTWCLCTWGACRLPVHSEEAFWQQVEAEKERLKSQGLA
jgi:hypothetical protein